MLLALVVPLAASAAPLVAQGPILRTAVEVVAETDVGLNLLRNTIAAGTPITAPRTVASAQGAVASSVTVGPHAIGLHLVAHVEATNVSPITNRASAFGTLELVFPVASSGWVDIDYSLAINSFATSFASTQVTAPGVSERFMLSAPSPPYQLTLHRRHFVSFPSSSTLACQFVVDASSLMPRRPFADVSVRVQFTPVLPPVRQQNYGPPCGLTFVVTDTTTVASHDMSLDVDGGFATSPVVFLFGGRRASIPIQGSPCLLLTEPIAAVGLTADGGGTVRWLVSLPGPLRSAPFDVQALAYDATLAVRTSHGVELQFLD